MIKILGNLTGKERDFSSNAEQQKYISPEDVAISQEIDAIGKKDIKDWELLDLDKAIQEIQSFTFDLEAPFHPQAVEFVNIIFKYTLGINYQNAVNVPGLESLKELEDFLLGEYQKNNTPESAKAVAGSEKYTERKNNILAIIKGGFDKLRTLN